jgi:type II secretory pathway component PulF
MAVFHYLAESPTGERVRGTLVAADEAAARTAIAARGLVVVEIARDADRDPVMARSPDHAIRGAAAGSGDPRTTSGAGPELGEEQLATIVHAVGAASASRVPLEVALAALAGEEDDRRVAKIARRLSTQLAQGVTVDEAMATMEHELPAELRGLFRAGVECGDLPGTFERFAEQRLAVQKTRRQIHAAIAYPAVILSILVPLALLLSMSVIPMFRDMFEEFDLELPAITMLVLQTAEQVPGLVGGLLLVVLGVPFVLRLVGGRWMLHRVRSATPVLGRLWMWSGQREFASTLSSFLDLRLPITSAVSHTGEVLGDRNVARACRRVRGRLELGELLSASLARSMHFDRSLVTFVAWGERHHLLPESLRIATEVYDDRIDQHAALLRRLIPPVTLVAVATVVFFVVISLMIPLVRLIEGLT